MRGYDPNHNSWRWRKDRHPPTGVVFAGAVADCGGEDAKRGTLVRAAVAADFAAPHQELVRRFEAATGFTVETSLGSTGQLYAQIENGAPFDVFLAADSEHPWRLEQTRLGVAGTRFTYAVGRLALYAPQWDSVRSGAAALDTHALNLSGWELGLEPGLAVYARVRSVAVPD